MIKDILFKKNEDNIWDIDFYMGDFLLTAGLETAILMSLFTDKRATYSEMSKVDRRRGWFGNKLTGYDNYEIGSKLWLLDQSRKDQNTLNLSKTYVSDCLSWLIADNIATKIDVDALFIPNGIQIDVILYRSQNIVFSNSYNLWENTNLVV